MTPKDSQSRPAPLSSSTADADSDSILLAEICDELSTRLLTGDDVSIESYIQQHPHLAKKLPQVFAAIKMMNVVTEAIEPAPETPVPQRIARFEIVRRLGEGGMGIVYEATHPTVSRRIAIKVLKPEKNSVKGFRQRFLREAEAASRLNHPNIVPFIDHGEDDETGYMSMMYIDGSSLDHILRCYWMDEQQIDSSFVARDFRKIAQLGADVASALEHAHAQQTIHRDIKPANLILDADGKIWVTDFGLAKLRDCDAELSNAGEMIGTPRYMAPEQLRGIADERSDIYSLGITLYELATGHRAWSTEDSAPSNGAVEIPPILEVNPAVPVDLAKIISKACAFSPNERYSSVADLQFALNHYAHGGTNPDRRGTTRPGLRSKFRDIALAIGLMAGLTIAATLETRKSAPEVKPAEQPVAPNKAPTTTQHRHIAVTVPEGTSNITEVQLTASDPNGDSFRWKLADSPDANLFIAQSISGKLSFKHPPAFATPHDSNGDNVYEIHLQATDSAQPHVAVLTTGSPSGRTFLREPAMGTSISIQLPEQILAACSSDSQSIWHMHLSNDGTVALYKSVFGQKETTTRLLQSDCHLSPFVRGIAMAPDGSCLAIFESRIGFELQWMELDQSNTFRNKGLPIPLDDITNPMGLSCLGQNDFQLLEAKNEQVSIWEIAVTDSRVVGVRELPAGWNFDGQRILAMAGWLAAPIKDSGSSKTQSIKIEVHSSDASRL